MKRLLDQIGDFEVCQQWRQPTSRVERSEKEMTVKELQKMAKVLGVKTAGLRKGELIKQIQKAEQRAIEGDTSIRLSV